MSDGMSDGKNYGPFLSKHGPPLISKDGKPLEPKCEHPEIMHNTKTDEHRCANERCNELVVGRKCGLCD